MDYISHKTILANLQRNFKHKQFDEEDILNWCQEVEVLYVADPDAMVQYLQVPLTVGSNRRVQLPSNIYKLQAVYEFDEKPENQNQRIHYRRLPNTVVLNKDPKNPVVLVNYIGTALDSDCLPQIDRNHQPACETWCKIQEFEEEALHGKIDRTLYFDWKQRFDGQIQAVKGGVDKWDDQDWAKMTMIQ